MPIVTRSQTKADNITILCASQELVDNLVGENCNLHKNIEESEKLLRKMERKMECEKIKINDIIKNNSKKLTQILYDNYDVKCFVVDYITYPYRHIKITNNLSTILGLDENRSVCCQKVHDLLENLIITTCNLIKEEITGRHYYELNDCLKEVSKSYRISAIHSSMEAHIYIIIKQNTIENKWKKLDLRLERSEEEKLELRDNMRIKMKTLRVK
jgi:hypothetical protein